jgi:hypothetical protein
MGSFSPGSHIDSGFQIDNVQSFFKVIGNNSSLCKLLRRDVIHFVRGRAKVFAVNKESSEIVVYFPRENIFIRYTKDRFVKEFCEIYPPLSFEEFEINPLLYFEDIIKLIQSGQAGKQETERFKYKLELLYDSIPQINNVQFFLNSLVITRASCSSLLEEKSYILNEEEDESPH